MKKPLLITLTWMLLPLITFAQLSKKLKYSSVYIAPTINYYAPIEPYIFFDEFLTQDENLILTFQTNNSGTFVIEDQELIEVERTFTFDFPSQLIGGGMSIQILNDKFLFHEFSITQFSIFKSKTNTDYKIKDLGDSFRTVLVEGEEQKTTVFGMRYEFGKYFGNKKSPVKFGLSAGVESTFYSFKMTPNTIRRFPITAKITTIELSCIPMLSFKIAKKVTLDIKVMSNFLIADSESVRKEDPAIPKSVNSGTRTYNLPEIDLGASLVLRCQIKEAKKRKRRKG